MTFRNYIVDAATQICEFNRKLTFGRLGPAGLTSHSTMDDIRNQAILVQEETKEFNDASSVLAMLDGTIDMLVTSVWLDVLERAFHDNVTEYTIEEAIEKILAHYRYAPLKLPCVEPMLMLARLGVDLQGATQAVIDDNNTKFVTEVKECATTVTYYRDELRIECEARPVDYYKREWGVFRLPDLKMLKPKAYTTKRMQGEGLNLLKYLPAHLRATSTLTLDKVTGDSPINTWTTRRID